MPFLCPQCRTATLETAQLEPDLPSDRCATCHGHWITYNHYFAYTNTAVENIADLEATAPEHDSPALKLCPACSKFMRYYPVALDLPFGIDLCNTCGGIWLNDHEWPALKFHHFHRQLHAIASPSWQTDLARERRVHAERTALLARLGPADFAELERIIAWLAHHPHQPELLAHLHQHLASRASTP